jgi:hypothetical protein
MRKTTSHSETPENDPATVPVHEHDLLPDHFKPHFVPYTPETERLLRRWPVVLLSVWCTVCKDYVVFFNQTATEE